MHTLEEYLEDDNIPPILDEMSYNDFMKEINPNNLPHRDYAPLIKYVKVVGVRGDTIKFFLPNAYNGWNTYIKFLDWEEQKSDLSLTAPEVARLLIWAGDIQVHCLCPAFKFWGANYILTTRNAAIIPEIRFPHIRNPKLLSVGCKHIVRTIKVLGFHNSDLAAAVKEQRKSLK